MTSIALFFPVNIALNKRSRLKGERHILMGSSFTKNLQTTPPSVLLSLLSYK